MRYTCDSPDKVYVQIGSLFSVVQSQMHKVCGESIN